MTLRWFISKTVRQAAAMRKHVHRLLCAQRDILSPEAVKSVAASVDELGDAITSDANGADLLKKMETLETTANKWLKPYPHAVWRENVEVLLVALAVAMAIRTFFLQPFKIPTGSMQPTLFGVTSENLLDKPDFKFPTGLARVRDWFAGISYLELKAKVDGTLDGISAPTRFLIFNLKQSVVIGGVAHTLWFPPDLGQQELGSRAGLRRGQFYHSGDEVLRLKTQAGDHLFVDRMTYNFRSPERGEIIVFKTAGIEDPRMPQDQFYIKRMVAMGGEKVRIGDDRHLVINGQRLDAATPHFEYVYSFEPSSPPAESQYSGHVNEIIARRYGRVGISDNFPDAATTYELKPEHFMVMGDNTMNSFDSRSWGEFPARNVIGKSYFIYWPITSRFGWGYR
jgi:signal peptidase I